MSLEKLLNISPKTFIASSCCAVGLSTDSFRCAISISLAVEYGALVPSLRNLAVTDSGIARNLVGTTFTASRTKSCSANGLSLLASRNA